MGTFSRSYENRPRSLADDFRARTDEQLTQLLEARPDLLHPVPTDLGQLAVRATTSPSVNSALDTLTQIQLNVAQALAGLPDPSSNADLHNGLSKATNYDSDLVDQAVQHLFNLGLVWGHDDELHLVRVAREAFGQYPCALAPSFSDSRRAVREYGQNPATVKVVLDAGPQDARDIINQMAWGTPFGTMRNANRAVRVEQAKSPLDWLLAHELLVPISETTVVIPREVSMAIRDGQLLQDLGNSVLDYDLARVDPARADSLGVQSGLDFIRLTETLLETWSIEPPGQLRGGGLAARDLTGAASLLKCDELTAACVIEVAYSARLLNADIHDGWLPTSTYDRWLGSDDATRWEMLALAWHDMDRAPHLVEGPASERSNVLSAGMERPFARPLRMTTLRMFSKLQPGQVLDAVSATRILDWEQPRRASVLRANAVTATCREAELLGITAMGTLTTYGRALVLGSNSKDLLARLLPSPVDHIIVQSDLTALAPGRLPATSRRAMAVLADVESTGVATTYRFTESSIRRGLDQGQSARDIIDFLSALSKTPLPQPLTYLVEDIARKHGALRVGVASVYLRCDDNQLIAELQVDRRLASLKLRQLADGIVVSSAPADMVLDKLRQAGYAPVAESAEGTVLIHRPDTKRTTPRPPTPETATTPMSPRFVRAALKAIRAGERTGEVKSSSPHQQMPRMSTVETMNVLNQALLQGYELWIGYADKGGNTSERIIEPLSLTAGFLTAFDTRSGEVRTFTISRITGAEQIVDPAQEGTA